MNLHFWLEFRKWLDLFPASYGATPQLQFNISDISSWCRVARKKIINLPSGFAFSVHANFGSFTLLFCKLSILSSHGIQTKLQLAYMSDVHSLKYEAHGKFGKRDRCLKVPECVSGNSLCHAMYTHASLTFAPNQTIVKHVKYNFSQFSIHIFICFEEILTNLTHSLFHVRSYEPKQSLYISRL